MLISTTAFAQLGLKSIGGGVGLITTTLSVATTTGTSDQSLTGFAIGGSANLGTLAENLYLVPDVGFWTASATVSSVKLSYTDFGINGNVYYMFGASQFTPYVGGGLGINFFGTKVETPSVTIPGFGTVAGGTVSGSATRLGINLIGGGSYALNNQMSIGAQLRYVIASDFNHLLVLATFRYNLDPM